MQQPDPPLLVALNDQLGPVVEVRGMLANGVQIPLAVRGVYGLRDGKTGVYVTMPDADGTEPRGCPTPGACSCPASATWVPVAERLPEPGASVLVARGTYVMRAVHVPHLHFCEATDGCFEPGGAAHYDEATDETYWPEGWYEWNEHEDTHWLVGGVPTHWMPLPAPPPMVQGRRDAI